MSKNSIIPGVTNFSFGYLVNSNSSETNDLISHSDSLSVQYHGKQKTFDFIQFFDSDFSPEDVCLKILSDIDEDESEDEEDGRSGGGIAPSLRLFLEEGLSVCLFVMGSERTNVPSFFDSNLFPLSLEELLHLSPLTNTNIGGVSNNNIKSSRGKGVPPFSLSVLELYDGVIIDLLDTSNNQVQFYLL